ncbi:MAG: alpha/beta fold hydrolase [Maritimibacter sp.]
MTQFQMIKTNGVTLRVAVEGDGPLVLLIHGFPESWYSWRHQIKALAKAGYKVAAPDMRGYGGSDKPHEVAAYSMETMTADIAGLARALSPDAPAVVVGHDWGAPLAWTSARLFPDVFRAVAGLAVAYQPPGDVVFIDLMEKLFTQKGRFFYQVYFQEEGVAEAELEADPLDSVTRFLWALSGDAAPDGWPNRKAHGAPVLEGMALPDILPAWLTQEDLAYYGAEFAASGFRGPLNRYRNWHRDHAFLRAHPSNPVIQQPSLFIAGTEDMVVKMLPNGPAPILAKSLANLRACHMLEGIGHWTQQEAPDAVNAQLLDWLNTL